MVSIEERNHKFYKPDGLKALQARLKTYIRIFNENDFPFFGQMLGFGEVNLENQKDCLARILELSDLIGFKAKLNMNRSTGVATIEF